MRKEDEFLTESDKGFTIWASEDLITLRVVWRHETLARTNMINHYQEPEAASGQAKLPLVPVTNEHLDISALETWLWDAACAIRGATDAPKFKDFILPLIFYKRLSDVFDDEFSEHVVKYGDEEVAREIVEDDHTDALKTGRKPIVRFYIPSEYRWEALRNHPADGHLGEFVIVHELVYLLAPKHGKLFKSFMNAYLPDWEKREQQLQRHASFSYSNSLGYH